MLELDEWLDDRRRLLLALATAFAGSGWL